MSGIDRLVLLFTRSWIMRGASASAVVFALFCAAAASGSPGDASICGATKCITVSSAEAFELLDWQTGPFAQLEPPHPVPYFAVRMAGMGVVLYVSGRKLLRVPCAVGAQRHSVLFRGCVPYWRTMSASTRAFYARFTRGIEPFPAAKRWP